jgi:ElaB/YqjD/DUF883 family membrane-anchored ribosome-binding protein
MEATRNDLSEKLEKLEKSVVDTVQEATTTMAEAVHGAREAVQATQDVVQTVKETVEGAAQSVQGTVDSVRDTMENVTGSVGGAVEGVKESFSDAADSVRDTFAGAAQSVKETFRNVSESVRDTFDLPKQVDHHPWLMMGGAVAVGFVAGKLLDYGPETMEAVHTAAHTGGRLAQSAASLAAATASAANATASASGGWMAALEKMFGPEVNKVKEMAIGALGGIIRDVAVQAAPEPMARQVRELIDSFTSKLGGKPVEGAVLGPRPTEEEAHNGPSRRF